MKRLLTALGLCSALLVFEASYFLVHTSAKTDVVGGLLRLPAPPPPNPAVPIIASDGAVDPRAKPPTDDAPLADTIAYWAGQTSASGTYGPEMSEKTFARLKAEIEKDPAKLPTLIGAFKDNDGSAEFIKDIYDREGTTGVFDRETRKLIHDWLVQHSSYFTDDLRRLALRADDTDGYVKNHLDLLQLARFDFDKARPIIDDMYSRPADKATRVVARWALYRHALDTNSIGDIDRYRDELKAIVEDRSQTAAMRDLAMDALVTEKEWPGRDEWYYSLLSDKTMLDMGGYTGLTTLINASPPDKYIDKMVELAGSGDPTVRAAAVRNLLLKLSTGDARILRVMLPWLEDPKWAEDANNARAALVGALGETRLPESVPGLIHLLDERSETKTASVSRSNANANTAVPRLVANTALPNSNSAAAAANTAADVPRAPREEFPFRSAAIVALGKQADPQAAGPLRRLLNEADKDDRSPIIDALIRVHGFTLDEQVEALEQAARGDDANATPAPEPARPYTRHELLDKIALRLSYMTDIDDTLAAAVVARVDQLRSSEPMVAKLLRSQLIKWSNPPISLMLLREIKHDESDVPGILRTLAARKFLRESLAQDVSDLRTGTPESIAFAACILEDEPDYAAILDGPNADSKAALFACGRLIRARLPLERSIAIARGGDKRLADAAEEYLVSEDSPAARAAVLSRHPNEAKILGATAAFFPEGYTDQDESRELAELYATIDLNNSLYTGWFDPPDPTLMKIEERLRDEVKKDDSLVGIYGYDSNYVRIYNDKAVYRYEEDDSRYKERPLGPDEFSYLKSYLAQNNVDEMPPYVTCGGPYCGTSELVMVGRGGGRRVFVAGDPPPFFKGLDKFFEDVRAKPAATKYALSSKIPGLEILVGNGDLAALTVWKNGDDLRVAVADTKVRAAVERELDDASTDAQDDPESAANNYAQIEKRRLDRAYEGISWRSIANGSAGAQTSQPAGVEYIPRRDGLAGDVTPWQWKARYNGVEIRSDGDALYKIAGGRSIKFKAGDYDSPLITTNGRWCIVQTTNEESTAGVARIDLVTGRVHNIAGLSGTSGGYVPVAYLPNINKVLIAGVWGSARDLFDLSNVDDDSGAMPGVASEIVLLDPDTGAVAPADAAFEPLVHQSFRPLQKATTPGTFWAAVPDYEKNETRVGIYDMRQFTFKVVLTVPLIQFDSMAMWVDEAANSVYFVYRGDLLKLPLAPPKG